MGNPCQRCGACCAYFRVSFYWAESVPFLDGQVPPELTEQINPHLVSMKGTLTSPARCVALDGAIGDCVSCSIYPNRPTPCRELEPWDEHGQPDEKCSRARAAHGLPPLEPLYEPTAPHTPEIVDPLRTGTD